MACVVWLPPDGQVQGRLRPVWPQVISHLSHGTPSTSAVTRWQSLTDSVPRLPMPDWIYSFPSGLMTNSPSNPTEPPTKQLVATPIPRALVPLRLGCAFRSSHRNASWPLSRASLINALVTYRLLPFASGGPIEALPSGILI